MQIDEQCSVAAEMELTSCQTAGDSGTGEQPASEGVLRIMTWNINCLVPTVRNMEHRYKSFKGFLEAFGIHIACFQEVKLPDAKITKDLACVPGYQSFWSTSSGKTGYSGVTTWCHSSVAPREATADCLGGDERPDLDNEGRLVVTDHGAFVLLNAYVPNAGDHPVRPRLSYKLAFLRALRAKMDELTQGQGRQAGHPGGRPQHRRRAP